MIGTTNRPKWSVRDTELTWECCKACPFQCVLPHSFIHGQSRIKFLTASITQPKKQSKTPIGKLIYSYWYYCLCYIQVCVYTSYARLVPLMFTFPAALAAILSHIIFTWVHYITHVLLILAVNSFHHYPPTPHEFTHHPPKSAMNVPWICPVPAPNMIWTCPEPALIMSCTCPDIFSLFIIVLILIDPLKKKSYLIELSLLVSNHIPLKDCSFCAGWGGTIVFPKYLGWYINDHDSATETPQFLIYLTQFWVSNHNKNNFRMLV